MTLVKKPFALACVAVAAVTLSAFAQTTQLNPTVKVLSRPQSPVPAECATDLDTSAPALEPEPQVAPERVTESVPPSNSLRASLRRLQVAAEGDDYAAYKAALTEARRAAASHPPGGERNAANEAIQVFTDIGRVWDYAMASPAGSFFDGTVQGGSLLSALKRYPDYGKTIASETITAGDRTLYPTRETRRFLARESSRRLSRLGVSVPARMAGPQPEWPRLTATPAPPVVKKPVQVTTKAPAKTTQANVAPKPARHKPATTPVPKTTPPGTAGVPPASSTHKPKAGGTPALPGTSIVSTKPPVATATSPASTSTHEPKAGGTPAVPGTSIVSTKPAVATATSPALTSTHESKAGGTPAVPGTSIVSTKQPVATATSTTTEAKAGGTPAVPGTSVVSTQPPPTTTAATATETTASSSTTPATAAPDTATTGSTAPAEKPNGNTNLIWAIVLILVGIGVLVILFRASD